MASDLSENEESYKLLAAEIKELCAKRLSGLGSRDVRMNEMMAALAWISAKMLLKTKDPSEALGTYRDQIEENFAEIQASNSSGLERG